MITVNLKPQTELKMSGDILICDPCYFFPHQSTDHHEAWQEIVRLMFPGGKSGALSDSGVAEVTVGDETFEFIYVSTKYGDGVYELTRMTPGMRTSGGEIGVDAGLICAIRKEDAEGFASGFEAEKNGTVVMDFEGEIVVDGDAGSLYGNGRPEFLVTTDGSDSMEEDPGEEWDDEGEEEED